MIKYNKIQGINAADIRKLCQEKRQKTEAGAKNEPPDPILEKKEIEIDDSLLYEIKQFQQKPLGNPLTLNRWGSVEYCHTLDKIIDSSEEAMIIKFINSDNNRWVGKLGSGTRRHQNWGIFICYFTLFFLIFRGPSWAKRYCGRFTCQYVTMLLKFINNVN